MKIACHLMKHQCFVIAALVFLGAATSHAQEVRTQAPCSPVVEGTKGNVTVTYSGGCTTGISPMDLEKIVDNALARRGVPPELLDRYEAASRQLGVTDRALTTFFVILGQKKVAVEDLDAKLREIAARHVTLLKRAGPSGDDDSEVAAIKKEAIASIAVGNYARVEELLQLAFDTDLAIARRAEDAVRRAQEVADKRNLTAAKTRADLGELKLTELRYAAAAEDFQAAAKLVPEKELLVRSEYLNGLGWAARHAGNFPLAAKALAEALAIREGLLHSEHPDIAVSLNNLALLLQDTNRLSEAEPLYRRALTIDEKSYGPDHPDVAIRLNNLGSLLQDMNRLSEAELLYRRALAIDEKSYGPDHPDVAIRLNNLAFLLGQTNRLSEAEPLYRRALTIDEKSYGPDHPDVAMDLNNLAFLLGQTKRVREADQLYRRALAIDENALGFEHSMTETIRTNLRSLQSGLGGSSGVPLRAQSNRRK
jgi:tetratricopeptide (TPR) repeat protein